MNKLEIKTLNDTFLKRLWELSAKEAFYPWTLTNAPYFNDFKQMSYEEFASEESSFYINNQNVKGLFVNDNLIGTVNRYWSDKDTRWMETGIVIFDDTYWNKGLATLFMQKWIDETFSKFELERVGLTTWSGNPGMMKVGTKLGMTQDRSVKNARYYNGVYYDSIGYGITRDMWNLLYHSNICIESVSDPALKSQYCEAILRKVPEWFGIEESTMEYIENVKTMFFISAKINDELVGFIAIDQSNEGFDEIYVIGVDPRYHRQNIGKLLVHKSLIETRINNKQLMIVKTLSPSISNQEYDITRKFYTHLGFIGIHEDTSIWGEGTPCLIMVLPSK